MVSAGEFRKGMTVEIDGQVWMIVDFQHVKPGKGAAFVRTKIKNVMTGNVLERTWLDGGYAVTHNAFHLVQRLHQVEESLTGRLAEVSDIDEMCIRDRVWAVHERRVAID